MKGDFSTAHHDEGFDALLVQQGRPLLDAQINGISMALIEGRENALGELLNLKGRVVIPPLSGEGAGVTIANNKIELPSSANYIYVDGVRAKIDRDSIPDPEADSVICVDIYEETLPVHPASREVFADPAIKNSDSVRLKRYAVIRITAKNKWDHRKPIKFDDEGATPEGAIPEAGLIPASRIAAPLSFQSDQSLGNALHHFMIAGEGEYKEENGHWMLWSKCNAGLTVPIATKLDGDKTVLHTESNKIYVPYTSSVSGELSIGQYVEFFAAKFTAPPSMYEESNPLIAVKKIKEVGTNYIVVEDLDGINNLGLENGEVNILRVWDGFEKLKESKETVNGEEEFLSAGFGDFTIKLPVQDNKLPVQDNEDKKIDYRRGDFWNVSIRDGEPPVAIEADRQIPVIRRGMLKEIPAENGDTALNYAEPALVASHHVSQISRTQQDHRDVLHYLNDVSASEVFPDPKALAVSRWLASAKLDEVVPLSKSQLRNRIKADCNAEEYDDEALEADLEMIVARCGEIV